MQSWLWTILFTFLFFSSASQDKIRLLQFEQKINTAQNDAEKIIALSELSEYFSIYKLDAAADSILQKALVIAEVSSDRELILKILFNNNITNLNTRSSKNTFEHSLNFIQKGLQYAQELKRDDFVALAYIRMAGISRKRYLYADAIQQATQAFTALPSSGADSLKCILFIELGDIYLDKADAVPAYKNYNSAFSIAYKQKRFQLESEIYHRFSELYRLFGDEEMAKKYLLQSLQLNLGHHNIEGQFRDYIDLARITNKREYIDKAGELAVTLHSDKYQLAAKRLLYYWYMVVEKNSYHTFSFLNSNPELKQFFENQGPATFHWQVGNIYRYASQYDSALYFYHLAEKELTGTHETAMRLDICNAIAETSLLSNDSVTSKKYFEITYDLCRQNTQLALMPAVCSRLGMLCSKNKDFKQAYYYAIQADSSVKLLQSNAAKDKVVLLQVDRENKKMESDLAEAAQKKQRKYNLQIMAITLMITGIFAFMLFLGMFAVSKTTIKMLGYFAFICLFEFIVLLLDHPLVTLTGGEPLKIWGIKIFLIAMLVPFQHFLESRLIIFLQSRWLLEVRQKVSFKNWWYRLKKPSLVASVEKDDTAVL